MNMKVNQGTTVEGSHGQVWKVERLIGEGTCCEVYRATDAHNDSQVAIKVFKDGVNYDAAHGREAMLLHLTSHQQPSQYLVRLVDDVQLDGSLCLVQELLDANIRKIIQKNHSRGLSLYVLQKLLRDTLSGLQCLHSCGFVHGDIKPTNLLWGPQDGCLKIIDFGLSFHLQDQLVGQLHSQGYRAPEVMQWNRWQQLQQQQQQQQQQLQQQQLQQQQQLHQQQQHQQQAGISPIISCPSCQPKPTRDRQHELCGQELHGQHCDSQIPACSEQEPFCPQDCKHSHVETSPPHGRRKADSAASSCEQDTTSSEQAQSPTCRRALTRPSKASDMWSLGCILMELFTGHKIFTREKLKEIEKQDQGGGWDDEMLQAVIQGNTQLREEDAEDAEHGASMTLHLCDLVTRLLNQDVESRITAHEALQHPFCQTKLEPSFLDLLLLPTPVLRLLNAVEDQDLEEDERYEDVKQDLVEECKKFGKLKSCVIPRSGPGRCKVYLEYEKASQAMTSYERLCHRTFSGHTLLVTYFPLDAWKLQQYH